MAQHPELIWIKTVHVLACVEIKILRRVQELSGAPDTLVDFHTGLGLDAAETRRLVAGFPPLLYLSVEDNLKPTLDWLQNRLDLDDEQLESVLKQGRRQ